VIPSTYCLPRTITKAVENGDDCSVITNCGQFDNETNNFAGIPIIVLALGSSVCLEMRMSTAEPVNSHENARAIAIFGNDDLSNHGA
jgi:hypothetical protein